MTFAELRPMLYICTAALALFAPTTNTDTVIFDNLGTGTGTTNFNSAFIQNGPFSLAAAESFVPSGTYSLDTVGIGLAISAGGGQNSFDVALMTDADGEPGSILESFFITDAPIYDPTSPIGVPPLVLTSILNPVLSSGTTYWLTAAAVGSDNFGAWQSTSGTDPATMTNEEFSATGLAGPWTQDPDGTEDLPRGAFEITGTAITPEPQSPLLIFSGLALFARRRMNRLIK